VGGNWIYGIDLINGISGIGSVAKNLIDHLLEFKAQMLSQKSFLSAFFELISKSFR
jgi:hypothetical protein